MEYSPIGNILINLILRLGWGLLIAKVIFKFILIPFANIFIRKKI